MSKDLKGKFSDKVVFEKYFGIAGVRIVEDAEGNLMINPTRKQLSEHYENFDAEGDELEYTGKANIATGYTTFAEAGGKKRLSEEKMAELAITDKDNFVDAEEVKTAKISFLVETQGPIKIKKLISFKMFEAEDITVAGDKLKVFNSTGHFTYQKFDGSVPSFFEDKEENMVKPAPMSRSSMDFEAMVNFIYAYSGLSKKVVLLDDFDLTAIFGGDFSCIVELMTMIHEDVIEDGTKLYGAMVLFTVENNANSRHDDRQGFYSAFERMVVDTKGTQNDECSLIQKSLTKDRQPQRGNRVYSPESKGIFVGHNRVAKIGLKEFKSDFMAAIKQEVANRSNIPTTKAPPVGQQGGTGTDYSEDIF